MKITHLFSLLKRCALLFSFVTITMTIFQPQAKAQTGVYVDFTGGKTQNTNWMYGPTIGAYFDKGHFGVAEWGIDVRGSILGRSGSSEESGLVGLRGAFHPRVVPIKPYGELLIGLGHVKAGNSSSTGLEYQIFGGVEYTVVPHVDWRVVEFGYGGLTDGGLHPKNISTGIVFRLPHSGRRR